MVVAVITAIVFIAVVVALFISESWMLDSFFDWIVLGLLGCLLGGLVSAGTWFGLTLAANNILEHDDKYYANYLTTLQDNVGVEGAYVLGSGGFNGVSQYSFYVDYGGYKKGHTINASGVKVFEEDVERPYIVSFGGCELKPSWFAECLSEGSKVVEIHVPKGTVKTDMTLDAN